jgi:hypothetical protein
MHDPAQIDDKQLGQEAARFVFERWCEKLIWRYSRLGFQAVL